MVRCLVREAAAKAAFVGHQQHDCSLEGLSVTIIDMDAGYIYCTLPSHQRLSAKWRKVRDWLEMESAPSVGKKSGRDANFQGRVSGRVPVLTSLNLNSATYHGRVCSSAQTTSAVAVDALNGPLKSRSTMKAIPMTCRMWHDGGEGLGIVSPIGPQSIPCLSGPYRRDSLSQRNKMYLHP
ncbi:hypothetical protein HRR83_004379 [Exophiala dermatitidis]|uniref:Uncharacterized protein n=1 Tax=Exophiala dermatitidis TaxID=5970 RepID=A0AAN6EV48_EXODE|nr:hypothetical protein HRR73_006158 [Exophiala dermatitidis]KAJ4521316.1 hypothetical protein HRR74_003139 [Exophiala dermatitidis]KAJ4541983.1 hypothetical protein HRR77_005874 [Exophiala dermatitidis]KAJ4544748.1 hypothetical protein HRR76_002792 [Exophiala dermatitidis]KAJ4565225.1 hypothetical protein HRR79_005493 [Exophiala dermatitidis]